MALATKQSIASSKDWEFTDIEVPKWGTVRIRSLSAKERLNLVKQVEGRDLTNEEAMEFYAGLIALAMIDEDGSPVWTMPDDLEVLQNRDWPKLEMVGKKIMSFNGMDSASNEEIAKN